MCKKHSKIVKIIVAYLSALCFSISASAHSTALDSKYWYDPNYTGWNIYANSKHWAKYNVNMTVSNGVFDGTEFATYITNAVNAWNDAKFNELDLLSISESSTGVVKFRSKTAQQIADTFGETYISAWGVVYRTNAAADSNNHYTQTAGNVQIWINWNDVLFKKASTSRANCSTHTALHELGHVIGLKDILSSVSPNAYLMCNGFGANYSVPKTITASDIKGAAVILGRHTSHTFATDTSNSSRKYCTKCGIYYFD